MDGASLLASLGATGWRNAPTPNAPIPTTSPAESFDRMLNAAVNGSARSGKSVNAEHNIQPTIDPATLDQLRELADQAEARGLTRVAVLDQNGDLLRMNVNERHITDRIAINEPIVENIDGIIRLPDHTKAT